MSLFQRYWAARFESWNPAPTAQTGYTLLVPVPGDLPVFLELALAVLGTQDATDRVETLVLPDRVTPAMTQIVQQHAADWDGPLKMVPLPMPERVILPRMRNPSRNHGVQVVEGVTKSSGEFIILHDADLFLLEPDVLQEHYRSTKERGLDACGVSPVWDEWFAEHGLQLAATWELCARRDWLRSFPPHMHMGHTAELFGIEHVFDTTLHPQALTDPARIGIADRSEQIVHFNYVISTYRHFQRAREQFSDNRFRLLLIRIFIDVFANMPHTYSLPSLVELSAGLDDPKAQVTYPDPDEKTRADYGHFRTNITRILSGPWVEVSGAEKISRALAGFDEYYEISAAGPR